MAHGSRMCVYKEEIFIHEIYTFENYVQKENTKNMTQI